MIKVNKATIIRELKQMKEEELRKRKIENNKIVEAHKLELISKYDDKLEALREKAKPVIEEYKELVNTLSNDPDIRMHVYYSSSTLIFNLESDYRSKKCIQYNADFKKGSNEVLKNKLVKEVLDMENEWNKLIIYCKSLPVKELRKYLEDNKIELECIKNENKVTETALVVQNINFNKLWSSKNVNK